MAQAQLPISDAERELAAGYILGDLAPEELAQFETLLQENPALQAEVQALSVSFNLFPLGEEPIAPPPHLRDRVLTAQTLATVARRRQFPWTMAMMTGIAVLGALLASFDNLRLRRELGIAQDAAPKTVASILQRSKSRLVALRSQPTDQPIGTLLFTPGQWQEIVVSLENVPPVAPGQAYSMWLALNNGEVLLCGTFQPNAEGRVFVTLHPPQAPPKGIKATGVFVTLDGAATPVQPQGERVVSGDI
jgi:Anti-sigma-K factor rskA